ncbi:MAG: Flp family type IVb pilin [Magnetovibrionaceae bacterium]
MSVKTFTKSFLADESGATAIEYGLIAALIAVAAIGGMTAVGTSLQGTYDNVAGQLAGGAAGGGDGAAAGDGGAGGGDEAPVVE